MGTHAVPATYVVLCSQLYFVCHRKPPTFGDRHPKVLEGHAELRPPPRYSVLERRGVKGDGGNPPLLVSYVVLCSQLYIVSHHKPPTLDDRHPKVLEGHAEPRPKVGTRVALPTPQRVQND